MVRNILSWVSPKSAQKVLVLQGFSAAKSVTPISFLLLPLGSFFFFVFRTAQLAIHLSWRFDIESSAAAFTLFHLAAAYFGIQIKVCRQHAP